MRVKKMKMPPMVIDEVILLVDTYFKTCKTKDPVLKNLYIDDLSNLLRTLPFFPEQLGNETFRNTSGMELMLMNIDYVIKGKWEKNKISKITLDVINRFQHDQKLLTSVAQAIKFIANRNNSSDYCSIIDNNFLGGSLLLNYHKFIETKTNLAVSMDKNMQRNIDMLCHICMSDLRKIYKEKAAKLLEFHFCAPITWYIVKEKPIANQFIQICPNCHKLAHSDVLFLCEDHLKDVILKGTTKNV